MYYSEQLLNVNVVECHTRCHTNPLSMRERNNIRHESALKLHRGYVYITSSIKELYKLLYGDNNLSQTNDTYKMTGMY